jgi:STE24 endopeptidase
MTQTTETTVPANDRPPATRALLRVAAAGAFLFLALFAVTSFPSAAEERQARAYGFTDAEISNGLRYSQQRRAVGWSATAVSFTFWTLVVLSGWGRRLADACARARVLHWAVTLVAWPLLVPIWLGALLVGKVTGRAFPGFFRWLQTVTLVGAVCLLAESLLSLPFGLLGLQVQRAWGMTELPVSEWLLDFAKGLAVSAVVGAVPMLGLYLLLRLLPRWWWAVAAAGITGLGMAYAFFMPVYVDPLFHNFRPLEHADVPVLSGSAVGLAASPVGTGPVDVVSALVVGGANEAWLEQDVHVLAARAGMDVPTVLVTDASRKSLHTNAYFTGFGPTRRIVLYDTLLHQHTPEEVESILGHEIGHWRYNHILKGILLGGLGSFFAFFLLSRILLWAVRRRPFALGSPSDPAGLPLIVLLAAVGGFLAQPAEHGISRAFERQADESALELGRQPDAFIAAEERLARKNIGNLAPNPIAVWFFATHPPALERIRMGMEWKREHPAGR